MLKPGAARLYLYYHHRRRLKYINTVFWTHAYNAERTLGRAIESILNQTYSDFIYYCLDNGSNDSTWRIICEYAAKDSRIVPLHKKMNSGSEAKMYWIQIQNMIQRSNKDGYFAFLDADDEYNADFLEKMISFAKENELDMAICGTKYTENNDSVRFDFPPKTFVFNGADKVKYLPEYYKYLTRYWAILYSIKLLPTIFFQNSIMAKNDIKKVHVNRRKKTAEFDDVLRTLNAVHISERIGVMRECLHSYYIGSNNQLSAQYTSNWFWWVNLMQMHLRSFALSYGEMCIDIENFTNIRFLIWLKYILPRLQNAKAPLKVRLRDISDIFQDESTKALLALDWKTIGIKTDKREFLKEQLTWVQEQHGNRAVKINSKKLIRILEYLINEASDNN